MGDRLKWGILGTADISESVIPAIQGSRGCIVTAVASRDPSRARTWADRFGIPDAFGAYDDMIRSGAIDAVYLPLPNSLHAEWTVRSLEAGLPVMCEKPLTVNAAEARVVAEVSRRTGLPVMEGFMYRFHPLYQRLQEIIDRGTIGRVSTIDAVFTFLLDDGESIVQSVDLAGGALLDVGCYPVNAARLLAGEEPVRVTAFERRDGVDRVMTGVLDFPGGVLARFETSIANTERHRLEVAGTLAHLVVEDPWVPGTGDVTILIRRRGQLDEVVPVEGANTWVLQFEHFARLVNEGLRPQWPVEDAVSNLCVLDALASSARQGRVVAVDRSL